MSRLTRLSIGGFVHHVIVRGNNHQFIFMNSADYHFYLDLLITACKNNQIALHHYVLMPSHVHLLLTPHSAQSLSLTIQQIGRSYARYFNQKYKRFGSLFEGRYRSTVIDPARYFLDCCVYIETNPSRAKLALNANEYLWSSYHHYCGNQIQEGLSTHPSYWQLGNTPFAREEAYRNKITLGIDPKLATIITHSALYGWALGDANFIHLLQLHTERRLQPSSAGRPRKNSTA